MRAALTIFLLLASAGPALAQPAPTPEEPAFALPVTGPLRVRNTNEPDSGPTARSPRILPGVLTVSGEFRQQFESWRNREFGLGAEADDDYLLQRFLLNFDLRPSEWLLLSSELGSAFKFGSPFEPSPIDEDPAYFQQLFADVRLAETGAGGLSARLGRQTFDLGSGRIVAKRNGPNIRRSFDSARLILDSDAFSSQLIAGSEALFGGAAFDNGPSKERMLWGSYNTLKAGPDSILPGKGGLDLYYLGYRNRRGRFDAVTGDERRHSLGLRAFGLFGESNAWDYNVEPVVQFGTIGDQRILAWTVASVIGYTFEAAPMRPRLGIKFNAISGDTNGGDGKLGTFNALYPNNSYFSEAAAFSPANLYDFNLNADLRLRDNVTFVLLWDFLWRQSTSDAIYVPPGIPAIAGNATDQRYIGNTISLALEWKPTPGVQTTVAYVHLEPGGAISEAGGEQADFVLLWATWFF